MNLLRGCALNNSKSYIWKYGKSSSSSSNFSGCVSNEGICMFLFHLFLLFLFSNFYFVCSFIQKHTFVHLFIGATHRLNVSISWQILQIWNESLSWKYTHTHSVADNEETNCTQTHACWTRGSKNTIKQTPICTAFIVCCFKFFFIAIVSTLIINYNGAHNRHSMLYPGKLF